MKLIDTPSPATKEDRPLASALMKLCGDDLEARACYTNSLKAMALFAHPERLRYVEGWLIILAGEYAIEHGWLEYDNYVVDITLDSEKPEQYYKVCEYTVDEAIAQVARHAKAPFFMNLKRARKAMMDGFCQLPIDHSLCHYYAAMGAHHTGVRSIILD